MGLAAGITHYSFTINIEFKTILDVFVEQSESITLEGYVLSYPIDNDSFVSFFMDVEGLVISGETIAVNTKVQVKTDTYSNYEYGMFIRTKGQLQKPEPFETDTGRIFDYDRYLEKDGVYYILPYAQTIIIDQGKNSIVRSLYAFKKKFINTLYRIIPAPESGLLAGILFGERSALSDTLEDQFRTVGLMHIVVLSGYNVSIIIKVVMKFLIFLPKHIRALFAVLGIITFALLVGAGPTVIRASIMAVFIVLADILSRRYIVERGLFVAGIIMVIINPKILLFDISFQLSFLATYGLIVFSPWLEKSFQRLPKIFAIRDSAVATIAAQIMVAPLIIFTIGEFSLISPVVNVLVLFAVPYAMGFGFIASSLYLLIPVFAQPFSLITLYLLEYQLWIVEIFSNIPFAKISFPHFHFSLMIIAYVGIWYWIRKIREN
jgi:competence protein ComEC